MKTQSSTTWTRPKVQSPGDVAPSRGQVMPEVRCLHCAEGEMYTMRREMGRVQHACDRRKVHTMGREMPPVVRPPRVFTDRPSAPNSRLAAATSGIVRSSSACPPPATHTQGHTVPPCDLVRPPRSSQLPNPAVCPECYCSFLPESPRPKIRLTMGLSLLANVSPMNAVAVSPL